MDESKAVTESLENLKYFEKHNLQIYLDDAVTQMMSLRLENQANKTKPTKFFKEYFCSVHQGTHVLFREYSFIKATLYNRLCVIKAITQIYKPLLYREDKLNCKDYHSLLQLVWPNIPFDVVQSSFDLFETLEQQEEVRLSFLEFVRAMKSSFCVGNFNYEAKIINAQIEAKIEEFAKICNQGEKSASNLSEADFLCSLEESGSDQASLCSITSNLVVQNTEFKRILGLKESNSFSSDEPVEGTGGKLSRSSSGSKDASKSEQNVSTFSRASSASLRGRLSGKQLSNSLTLLQTEKLDTENFSTRRHRSKSAVAIQRNLHGRP
ncbi:UPF0705 protein C11orf49 [Trichonephila inaurata madagascariensis]|uniref:Centriolar satellite-associated tubulin polyglutamylase complex regulator 1 n=1 Tax=Trichonephila inaurata madagascariensis TaxID=2747483 RepID=A0A8X6YZ36_9ARAC|nr:UPF0705 protein C11orf49 [Trichonephila inaurata madagascariensis]